MPLCCFRPSSERAYEEETFRPLDHNIIIDPSFAPSDSKRGGGGAFRKSQRSSSLAAKDVSVRGGGAGLAALQQAGHQEPARDPRGSNADTAFELSGHGSQAALYALQHR